jgi:hypothetical protein
MKDDPSKLKSVLLDYFDGIKTNDLEKMNLNTTSDFLLFESGKVWNNDSLWTNGHKYKETRISTTLNALAKWPIPVLVLNFVISCLTSRASISNFTRAFSGALLIRTLYHMLSKTNDSHVYLESIE